MLTLAGEIWRYRNDRYYYYYLVVSSHGRFPLLSDDHALIMLKFLFYPYGELVMKEII